MAIEKPMEKRLLALNAERKKREFFVVKPTIGTNPPRISRDKRLKNWTSMFEKVGLASQIDDKAVEGNAMEGSDIVVFRFNNGLQISDTGRHVAFSVREGMEKSDVNMESAMSVIRCSANHLCRQGWDLGIDFESVRYGSANMVLAFEKSHQEARQKLNSERIAALQNNPLQM